MKERYVIGKESIKMTHIEIIKERSNPYDNDVKWLIEKLEKAIEMAEFYGSPARMSYKSPDNELMPGTKAREFLEGLK